MIPRTLIASPYVSRSILVRARFCGSFIYQSLANQAHHNRAQNYLTCQPHAGAREFGEQELRVAFASWTAHPILYAVLNLRIQS
jgi:hypothetical protein